MDAKKYTYLVELSDKRNIILLGKLKENFAAEEFSFADAAKYAFENAAIVFSPARRLDAEEAAKLPPAAAVMGGNQRPEIAALIKERGAAYVNLLENETYAVKNAKLTAEGALALVIGNTARSVYENNVLILGCGRVGKAVALLLQKTGVRTSVASFDKAEFDAHPFYAETAFYGRSFVERLPDYDVIINTVPAAILDGAALCRIRPGAVIIELASSDCLDRDSLGKYPFRYIPAPGLPVKYSPESAADIMLEAILNIEYGIWNR